MLVDLLLLCTASTGLGFALGSLLMHELRHWGTAMMVKRETFEPVTLGHIRSHGCRDLQVYCGSINCNHGITMNADHLPDHTPIRPLGSRMVCTRCGHIGADVRSDWGPHVNKRHV